MSEVYAPGMRIEARDAEWRVRSVDHCAEGGFWLECEGLSELVRGRDQVFLSRLEPNGISVLEPGDTTLVDDLSDRCREGLLYLDTQLRSTPATDSSISQAHQAAIDQLPFQFVPAVTALNQPRQRILIGDAVGLGKTLEAGILVSELIARGRGKRILVLAVKSMLAQFQREFWNRFTIPLTRLDSTGIQRIRSRIPANHNPFHYFDRAIVSIDTLKQDLEYRHHIENAYWDIIIIDECHNVAHRSGHSQRSRLADLLATRSDTLIMLSATPHDGKAESFASLVNMLDPTAIVDAKNYGQEDFRDKSLVIRRMKADVMHQLQKSFPERNIDVIRADASPEEEAAFDALMGVTFNTLDRKTGTGGRLFRTVLEKALFSSPMACSSVIHNRCKRLEKGEVDPGVQEDIDTLRSLDHALSKVTRKNFSKYLQLIALLTDATDFGWNPQDENDRLVIFTESIPTLEFLNQHLPKELGLKKNQVATLKGQGMRDREVTELVERFGMRDDPLRLLLCTDMASEGINLHYCSHRMVHFDIPWSLMVFQQRNGRIDRYGQTHRPEIRYLVTDSQHAQVRGDVRVLEVLIEKDDQASRNLGDPSEFAGELESQAQQETATIEAIESDAEDAYDAFADFFQDTADSAESDLGKFSEPGQAGDDALSHIAARPRIYPSAYEYAKEALQALQNAGENLSFEVDDVRRRVRMGTPKDLEARLRYLPREILPENQQFTLIESKASMDAELQRCREDDSPWPDIHYLWDLHPVVDWLADRMSGRLERHSAPVIRVPDRLHADEQIFVIRGGFPNRRGHSVIDAWYGACLGTDGSWRIQSIDEVLHRLELGKRPIANPGRSGDVSFLQQKLPIAVEQVRQLLIDERARVESALNQRLSEQLNDLEKLKARHQQQLNLRLEGNKQADNFKRHVREAQQGRIDRIFNDFLSWIEDTQTLEPEPWMQVGAVFTGRSA